MKGRLIMLRIVNFGEVEYLKTELETGLEELAENFSLLNEEDISLTAHKVGRKNNRIELVSNPLPVDSLGVWAYAVSSMQLVVDVFINDKNMIFGAKFHYVHRDGGMNGTSISDLGSFRTKVNLDTKSKKALTMSMYSEKLLRSALRAVKHVIQKEENNLKEEEKIHAESLKEWLAVRLDMYNSSLDELSSDDMAYILNQISIFLKEFGSTEDEDDCDILLEGKLSLIIERINQLKEEFECKSRYLQLGSYSDKEK